MVTVDHFNTEAVLGTLTTSSPWQVLASYTLRMNLIQFLLAECHRQCLVAAVEDTKMSSEGEKRRWKGFQGSEEDLKRDSLTGGDNWGVEQEGNGRALSGKGKNAVGKRKWEKIIGTCHQPPNIGTCESSVARYVEMVVLHILTFTVQIPSTCRPIFFFCFYLKNSTKVVVGRDSWYLQTVPMDWVGVPKHSCFLRISFSGVAATVTTLDLWKNASQDVKELDYSEYLILC